MTRKPSRDAGKRNSPSYAVGYGKPPLNSQFKPGQSGNAKGRPRGQKNLKTLIKQAMISQISVREGSNDRRVTKIEGVVLRQIENALKGNDRSAMAVIKMATALGFLEDKPENGTEEIDLTPPDERILNELAIRLKGPKKS